MKEQIGVKISEQESKSFWGGNSLRPDVVLRKGSQTFIIDTKWKRPKNNTASVSDLRLMYAYCRFWDAEKALLLYPGDTRENSFKSYLTDDYVLDQKENHSPIEHQCKMGFVSVLDSEVNLRDDIAANILKLLDFEEKQQLFVTTPNSFYCSKLSLSRCTSISLIFACFISLSL